jgi:F-type H+-transporting ATPase subunit c
MTKKLMFLLFMILLAAPVLLAQAAPANAEMLARQIEQQHTQWMGIAGGFSMAFASGLCGLAQARAVAGCAEGMARNPGASAAIRFALILGLVLIESLALYTLVIIIIKVV